VTDASINNLASFNYDKNKICSGSEINFVNASLGLTASVFWEFPGGTPSTSTSSSPKITYNTPGKFNVTMITTFVNGVDTFHIDSLIEVIPIPTTPTITVGTATTFCTGGSVTLTSNAAIGNQWYKDGVAIVGLTATTYIAIASGSYTTKVTFNGCESTASNVIVVTVNPLPAQPTAITGINSVVLAQTLNYSINPITNATGYNWQLSGGGTISNGQNTTTVTINWTALGNYTLSVNAINGCGNSLVQSKNIEVSAATAVTNPDNSFLINVVPNPTTGEFYLIAKGAINKDIHIEVFDLLGQKIFTNQQKVSTNNFSQMINLRRVSNGVYYIKIFIDKKVYVRKITKQG
jgi:hypothetical protein